MSKIEISDFQDCIIWILLMSAVRYPLWSTNGRLGAEIAAPGLGTLILALEVLVVDVTSEKTHRGGSYVAALAIRKMHTYIFGTICLFWPCISYIGQNSQIER